MKTILSPTHHQKKWLCYGLSEPGGKLPLFDKQGKKISERTISSCIKNGWAELWFQNPIHPNWLVCKLTCSGREILSLKDKKEVFPMGND